MSFVAAAIGSVAGAGASIFGAYEQSQSNQAAQDKIQQSIDQARAQVTSFTNQGAGAISGYTGKGATSLIDMITKGVGALSPFANAGKSALPTLESLITPGSNMTDVLSQIPGFKFAQDWGMRGINNAATTSGLGGNVLKAGADYSSGLAQNTWQSIVQALQGVTSTGAGAAGQQTGALSTGGLGLSSLFGGAGSALSSLFSGAGNALGTITQAGGQNLAQLTQGGGNILAAGAQGVGSSLGSIGNILMLKNILGGGAAGGGSGSVYQTNS